MISWQRRFALGAALLVGGTFAWTPINRRSPATKPSATKMQQFDVKDFRPIQWAAAGLMAASLVFTPLPSQAIIDPTPVSNDLSVRVETKDDDVTISFSLPRSLIKSIDINENKGQAKPEANVPPPVMPAPENRAADAVKGALNALGVTTKEETPDDQVKEEPLAAEVKEESKQPVDVKIEGSTPAEEVKKVDEAEPAEEKKIETPAAVVEQKQEAAKVEEAVPVTITPEVKAPAPEPPKQEAKVAVPEPPQPEVSKPPIPEPPKEEVKKEPVAAEVEIKKEEAPVKVETPPKTAIIALPKQETPSKLSGSIVEKLNKAGEASKAETPKAEAPKPETPKPALKFDTQKTMLTIPKRDVPKLPVETKTPETAGETGPSGHSKMFGDFTSSIKGKKKEKPLPFWERPFVQTTLPLQKGDVHLAVTNGQVAGVSAIGIGAAVVATFKADNSERQERKEEEEKGDTATRQTGPKPEAPSTAEKSFVDAAVESFSRTTSDNNDANDGEKGSFLSAFLRPKKSDDSKSNGRDSNDHKRQNKQKEEAVAAAKRAIAIKREAASRPQSKPSTDAVSSSSEPSVGRDRMPGAGIGSEEANRSFTDSFSNTREADDSQPTSSFPSRTRDSGPASSEELNRSSSDSFSAPGGTTSSPTPPGVPSSMRDSGQGISRPDTNKQQRPATTAETPALRVQDQDEPVVMARRDDTTGRYVVEYEGTRIYEWEQSLEGTPVIQIVCYYSHQFLKLTHTHILVPHRCQYLCKGSARNHGSSDYV